MNRSAISVLLVDDHEAFRTGLRALLAMLDDIVVVGEATDGNAAIAQTELLRPDVVLMDLRMAKLDGIAATRKIVATFPKTRVLVLTTFDEDLLIREAVVAGASGYLLKGTPSEDIAELIRLCAKGYSTFGPGVVPSMQTNTGEIDAGVAAAIGSLSGREKEILALIGCGFANREIAEQLSLSEGTVRNYVSSILAHLQSKNRTQLALMANAVLARAKLQGDYKRNYKVNGRR